MTNEQNGFTKVVRVGTLQTYGGRWSSLYCKVEYNGKRLSIEGVIGPLLSGNSTGGCGQIDMEFAHRIAEDNDKRTIDPITPDQIRFAEGWDAEKWLAFLEVWKAYHLNDLKPGCIHQTTFGWGRKGNGFPSEGGLLCVPCPICGYKYGSAWLSISVPEDVLEWLRGLPDADRQPAWV